MSFLVCADKLTRVSYDWASFKIKFTYFKNSVYKLVLVFAKLISFVCLSFYVQKHEIHSDFLSEFENASGLHLCTKIVLLDVPSGLHDLKMKT